MVILHKECCSSFHGDFFKVNPIVYWDLGYRHGWTYSYEYTSVCFLSGWVGLDPPRNTISSALKDITGRDSYLIPFFWICLHLHLVPWCSKMLRARYSSKISVFTFTISILIAWFKCVLGSKQEQKVVLKVNIYAMSQAISPSYFPASILDRQNNMWILLILLLMLCDCWTTIPSDNE